MRSLPMMKSLLAVGLLAASLHAAPIALKDVTQSGIVAQVDGFAKSADGQQWLAKFQGQVALKSDSFTYLATNGIPQQLEVRYKTLAGYDRAKEAEIQVQIREFLYQALTRYNGGLLTERDARFLLSRVSLVAVPDSAAATPPKSPPIELTPRGATTTRPAPASPHAHAMVPGPMYGPLYGPAYSYGYWYYGPTWHSTPYGYVATYGPRFIYYPWQNWTPQYAWQYPWYLANAGYPWWTHTGMTPNYGYRGY